MSCTLFFTNTLAVPLSGKASSFTVNVTWSGGSNIATSGYSMTLEGSSSIFSGIGTSLAQTAAQTHFIQSFVSPPFLQPQTILANNIYTIAINAAESSLSANFLQSGAAAFIYLFRPGAANTTVVSGFVSGWVAPAAINTPTLESGTVIGTVAVNVQSGDRIVLELYWLSGQQAKATRFSDFGYWQSGVQGYLLINQKLTFGPPSLFGSQLGQLGFSRLAITGRSRRRGRT